MDGLIASCNELGNRQAATHNVIASRLEELKAMLQTTKDNLEKDPAAALAHMKLLQEKTKKFQLTKTQKEYQGALSKFGKEIERRFKQDLSVIYHSEAFADKGPLLRRAIAMHFIREGQFELCDLFVNEADPEEQQELREITDRLKQQFEKMYSIIQELDDHLLHHAIQWAQAHHDELIKLGSSLEFNLHRLRFIQLAEENRYMDAVAYSRQYFGQFADKHFSEIKRLMTSTIMSKMERSPYADLRSPTLWADIRLEFQRDFCSLHAMSAQSPLYTSVLVGTTALPVILKLHKIMSNKKTEWSQQDELPVEIPLDPELRFHSVFACPVSKEQATEENPPMMMPCSHAICKESLMRLSRSSRNSMRFKCPYCPSESSVDQAVQIYF
ncbi:hypothetical protein EC973_001409 [Apophysomyces ossiformis]|uniref:GID complex catalytic subunit 2 n=1 Tax=Apophysomyces ossiformis TaxID=679940 RepID=A0A8H7EN88_9FUNG|nr:hypothetical protein EC973_001409 [Apophysomyces ossiformis]